MSTLNRQQGPEREPWPIRAWCGDAVSAHRLNQHYICCRCFVGAGWPPCDAHLRCREAARQYHEEHA